MNAENEPGKRFHLSRRRFHKSDTRAFEMTRSYLSRDLSIETLMADAEVVLDLPYAPTQITDNDTGKEILDLRKARKNTVIVVSCKKKAKTVTVIPNVLPPQRGDNCTVKVQQLVSVLIEARTLLKLDTTPKRVYRIDGRKINHFDEIKSGETLIVTGGEPCVVEAREPEKKASPRNARGGAFDRASMRDDQMSNFDRASTVSEMESEDAPIKMANHIVAVSNETFKRQFCMAELAVYKQLGNGMNWKPREKARLEAQMRNVQISGFANQLLKSGILPGRDKDIEAKLAEFSLRALNGVDLSKLSIVVVGDRRSGKSTFLHTFTSTVYRKMLICGVNDVLPFVVDFQRCEVFKDDPGKIYTTFVHALIDAARFTRFEIVQSLDAIKDYLLAIPTMSVIPRAPAQLESMSDLLKNLTVVCKRKFGNKKDRGMVARREETETWAAVAEFPVAFARAIGCSLMFIFDHMDRTKDSLCKALIRQGRRSPWFVATRRDAVFLKLDENRSSQIDTSGLIAIDQGSSDASIVLDNTVIREQDCMGCPAYVAQFRKIVRDYNMKQPMVDPFLRTKAGALREMLIRQELFRLCVHLESTDPPVVTKDLLNKLGDEDTTVNMRIEVPPPAPEGKNA